MTKLKTILILFSIVILFGSVYIFVNAKAVKSINYNTVEQSSLIDPTTNFFGQVEDKILVAEVANDDELISSGYELIGNTGNLKLYIDKSVCGIAVYDTTANYIWYSCYKNYKVSGYNDTVKEIISSGVTIEVYDSSTLNETTKYCATTKDCTISYQNITDGVIASFDFKTVGVSFDVEIKLTTDGLVATVLFDTLKEVPYKTIAMKYAKEYKLKAVTLFPYFGSDNYNINAYAFIPDGSGALIKYTSTSYDTAYIKRVYGTDLGVQLDTSSTYLKNENNISMPIYGINHGYNQASVLVEVTKGYGSCELHSYPYNYSNLNLNRTFMKYIARDKYNIEMASATNGAITIINSDIYTNTYELTYKFLAKEDSGYVGMAKAYKEKLGLSSSIESGSVLKLDVVCQDYKKGLFGKNYIEMTSYKELLNILKDLKGEGVGRIEINYIGYNKNGYFDNTLTKVKIDSSLGSKNDYYELLDYCLANDVEIYYYSNPLVATRNVTSKKTIKKLNLKIFEYNFKSSIEQSGRIINPNKLSDYFFKYDKQYDKLKMSNFSFDYVGSAAFSYRYAGIDYSREEMVNSIKDELEKISSNYNIALSKPNNYLFNSISSYYDVDYESSKYSFITSSIPFISLVLSGNVTLYSSNINYVSNYDLYALRMLEYGINPSYVITNNPTSDLRYCNYEYLFTTEFGLWKDNIISLYNKVSDPLNKINGSSLINHIYIASGVVECSYSNGVMIYINYTNNSYNYGGLDISPMSAITIGGDA